MLDMETITLQFDAAPPTANLIWRNGRGHSYLSPKAAAFYEVVGYVVAGRSIPSDWEAVDVEIIVRTKQGRGDVDNRIKPVLDALTRARFWDDDRRVGRVACQFARPGKEQTRVIVRPLASRFVDLN